MTKEKDQMAALTFHTMREFIVLWYLLGFDTRCYFFLLGVIGMKKGDLFKYI